MEMNELSNENLDQISAGEAAGEGMTVKDYVKSKPEVLKKVRDLVEYHNYQGAVDYLRGLGDLNLRVFARTIVDWVANNKL